MPKKVPEEAWVVTVDMGYGHQRAAYPLKDIAYHGIITANNYPGIPDKDKFIWENTRGFYEFVSRFKMVPFIGDKVFDIYDRIQAIPQFYPKRDLSHSNLQLDEIYKFFEEGDWGKHLITKLAKKPLPFITTFFATAMMAEYYAQRAAAGLIITEATAISQQGEGYPNSPGIDTDEQVAGWRRVTGAVHRADGRIFLQLWHMGRMSHPSFQPDGGLPVAPSAIAPRSGQAFTETGMHPYFTRRALKSEQLPGIVAQYAAGAKHARIAGFDGVEIHNANGYLLDQFLRDGTNHRTDEYGGSPRNRAIIISCCVRP